MNRDDLKAYAASNDLPDSWFYLVDDEVSEEAVPAHAIPNKAEMVCHAIYADSENPVWESFTLKRLVLPSRKKHTEESASAIGEQKRTTPFKNCGFCGKPLSKTETRYRRGNGAAYCADHVDHPEVIERERKAKERRDGKQEKNYIHVTEHERTMGFGFALILCIVGVILTPILIGIPILILGLWGMISPKSFVRWGKKADNQ